MANQIEQSSQFNVDPSILHPTEVSQPAEEALMFTARDLAQYIPDADQLNKNQLSYRIKKARELAEIELVPGEPKVIYTHKEVALMEPFLQTGLTKRNRKSFESKEEEEYPTRHFDYPTQIALLLHYRGDTLSDEQEALIKDAIGLKQWRKHGTSFDKFGPKDALNMLIESNRGLVRYIANKYQGRGVELEDLKQEGDIGLWKGIRLFDENRGYALSTYVTWWIREKIIYVIKSQNNLIHVPLATWDNLPELRSLLEQETTPEKILDDPQTAFSIGIITEREYKVLRDNTDNKEQIYTNAKDKLYAMIRALKNPTSLDKPTSQDEQDGTLYNFLPDEQNLIRSVLHTDFKEKLQDIHEEILDPREIRVLDLLKQGYSYVEIGKKLGVTRERIRQIFSTDIVPKLQKSAEIKQLYCDYEDVLGDMP